MKDYFLKIMLLGALITFFVIRPFLVANSYGFPGLLSTIHTTFQESASIIAKRDDVNSYHVSHVSACDDTSFRKVVLNAVYKLLSSAWKLIVVTLAVFIAAGLTLRLRGRRTIAEIITPHRYFNSLCLLRI